MLEFNKVLHQVEKMGNMLEELDFDLNGRLSLATHRFQNSGNLEDVWERIEWVRQSDVSGYRGAAPPDFPNAEPINLIVPAPELPESATIIAADGSQVYPDEQSPAHYYLLNLGLFIYHHGDGRTPEPITVPELYFHKAYVHDRYGRVIKNRTVDDRRTVAEMQALAREAWARRDHARPLITLYDNRLLFLPGGDSYDSNDLMRDYFSAMVHLHDSQAILAGYIDNPFRSKRMIQLLYLMSLTTEDEVKEKQIELTNGGDLDGLRDQQFFAHVLKSGERSAIMVQNSPKNLEYRQKGNSYEIAFFYMNVGMDRKSAIVRVDIPVWVARDPRAVNHLHALLLHQCRLQGRNPYPYVITRADELAYVGRKDRDKLDQMVRIQVRRIQEELAMQTFSPKSRGKELARGDKREFEI